MSVVLNVHQYKCHLCWLKSLVGQCSSIVSDFKGAAAAVPVWRKSIWSWTRSSSALIVVILLITGCAAGAVVFLYIIYPGWSLQFCSFCCLKAGTTYLYMLLAIACSSYEKI